MGKRDVSLSRSALPEKRLSELIRTANSFVISIFIASVKIVHSFYTDARDEDVVAWTKHS